MLTWSKIIQGAVESHLAIKNGNLTVLSVQNLVDCIPFGCKGGYISYAFNYMRNGINLASGYPYQSVENNACKFDSEAIMEKVAGYKKITTEPELERVSINFCHTQFSYLILLY
jgi:hypothetical protein